MEPQRTTHTTLIHGTLSLKFSHSSPPFEQLCSLASRKNNKRPWLFVSRVLGRHLPVAPSTMRAIHAQMARMIHPQLPGPVLILGMAETAIGLGQGVHEAYLASTQRHDVLYLHSTRYHLDRAMAFSFEEQHSHATHHRIYEPDEEEDLALFHGCRSLVLIDDEASTGSTFRNLIHAITQRLKNIQEIHSLVITDWMGAENREKLKDCGPCPVNLFSVLSGSYTFKADQNIPPPVLPDVIGNRHWKDALLPCNYGRLGMRSSPKLPSHITHNLEIKPREKILVLGTGEFVYLPYVLARFAEASGAHVRVQATTRSPILLGGDITSSFECQDAYDDGIPNFIYSVDPSQYDRIFICYETPPETRQVKLLESFHAQAFYFSHPEITGASR